MSSLSGTPLCPGPGVTKLTRAMVAWLAGGRRGISSNSIFTHLTGMDAMAGWPHPSAPLDPDDLGRCRRLLELCPELRAALPRMAGLSPVWAAMVAEWDELCALMDEENPGWRDGEGAAPRTYHRMQALHQSARNPEPAT